MNLIPSPKILKNTGLGPRLKGPSAQETRVHAWRPMLERWVEGTQARSQIQLSLGKAALRGKGSYMLEIGPDAVLLQAYGEEEAFHGLQTLAQIIGQCKDGRLPGLLIEDWPDFPVRGLSYDISRGRVPKLERLFELVNLLASYKINQLQLYTEHTFRFLRHPKIGENASPMNAEEIRLLDRYCRDRHIELVPSLASFGHMARILSLEPYRHLAEDWGSGTYVDPEAGRQKAAEWMQAGWTLCPLKEESYEFLESLYAEYLPLFSSKKFNACCDETFDLGWGQSMDAVKERGRGAVYTDHLLRLHAMAKKYGKRMQIWGDVIRHYPQDLQRLPADVVVLDWKYDPWDNFAGIGDLKAPGRSLYACPSVSSWGTLFPRLPYAAENMSGFARAAHACGAEGFLNTDWGDGGHFNFLENSWLGFGMGAELGWDAGADVSNFTRRFCAQFLGIDDPELSAALDALGAAATASRGKPERFWTEVFFADARDAIFEKPQSLDCFVRGGRVLRGKETLGLAEAQETRIELERVVKVLAGFTGRPGVDSRGVLPYWLFAAEAMCFAAEKFELLCFESGPPSEMKRAALAERQARLKARFEELWFARNRISEISTSLGRYERSILSLRGIAVAR